MASAKSSSPCTEFTLFPKLPPELRRDIWDLSLPGPRVVELLHEHDGVFSSALIPVALHVCKEAREEALRFYQLGFHAEFRQAKVYFDFSIDILYLGYLESSVAVRPMSPPILTNLLKTVEDMMRVKSLALCRRCQIGGWATYSLLPLQHMDALELVTLTRCGMYPGCSGMTFVQCDHVPPEIAQTEAGVPVRYAYLKLPNSDDY